MFNLRLRHCKVQTKTRQTQLASLLKLHFQPFFFSFWLFAFSSSHSLQCLSVKQTQNMQAGFGKGPSFSSILPQNHFCREPYKAPSEGYRQMLTSHIYGRPLKQVSVGLLLYLQFQIMEESTYQKAEYPAT